MLKTGSQNWDKYLQSIADLKRPIKILEVGSYEGWATELFLTHFAKNPNSRVYAIDTWEGSPEYVGTDFHEVEETFRRRVKRSGREDQLVTLKMKSEDGLHHLLDSIGKESIDIAFIDASHEARDVLSDAILVWKLMKENGIVIFDDYIWMDLKQEFFRPRLAIDSFIRCYAPELRVLGIDRQAFVKKLDRSKWITPTLNYDDWKVVLKKVTSLSDAVLKLPAYNISRVSRSTRKSIRKTIESSSTDIILTDIPSYTKADDQEYEINHKFLPNRSANEQLVFYKTIIPIMEIYNRLYKNDYNKYASIFKYSHLSEHYVYPYINSDTSSILEIGVLQRTLDTMTPAQLNLNINLLLEFNKLKLHKLKHIHHLYIKKEGDNKSYSDMPWLYVESISSLKFISLKPNSYDYIIISTISDNAFTYPNYKSLNYKGRDSLCIKWISFYLLASIHCLQLGGMIRFSMYGDRTPIVCEFLSFISTFFSKEPILYVRSGSTEINATKVVFNGYKGITKEKLTQLQNWYTSLTPGHYYKHLGTSCNKTIKTMLDNFSIFHNKKMLKLVNVAKQLRELFDGIPTSKKEDIIQILKAYRINNYFTEMSNYIKDNS